MMWSLLEAAGAEYGDHHNGFPHLDEEKEAKMISDSIPTVGIISALLVTISFAAAFAIPGGYLLELRLALRRRRTELRRGGRRRARTSGDPPAKPSRAVDALHLPHTPRHD